MSNDFELASASVRPEPARRWELVRLVGRDQWRVQPQGVDNADGGFTLHSFSEAENLLALLIGMEFRLCGGFA